MHPNLIHIEDSGRLTLTLSGEFVGGVEDARGGVGERGGGDECEGVNSRGTEVRGEVRVKFGEAVGR